MLTPFDKALVALLGSALTAAGMTSWGHVLSDPALQSTIISMATAIIVFAVPNKPSVSVTIPVAAPNGADLPVGAPMTMPPDVTLPLPLPGSKASK